MTQPKPAQDSSLSSLAHSLPLNDNCVDEEGFVAFMETQNPQDVEAATWQVRKEDGLTAKEEVELQSWLNNDPVNAATFSRVQNVCANLDRLVAESGGCAKFRIDRRHSCHAPKKSPTLLQAFISACKTACAGSLNCVSGLGRTVLQRRLITAVFLVAGCGWFGWDYWTQQPTFAKTYATRRGQQLDVRLPDGSTMTLDTSTSAEVNFYRNRRVVRLPEGQAIFTVNQRPGQSFDVVAGAVHISVTGTQFVVRNTLQGLNSGRVSVMVEHGRVQVSLADSKRTLHANHTLTRRDTVELTTGQSIETDVAGHLGAVALRSPASALLWRERRVNFERTPLHEAVAEFERYADTRLVIRDPAVAALRVSGSFSFGQSGMFTQALPQVLPVVLLNRGGVTEINASR